MRINKYLALAIGVSRRAADSIIARGEVTINDLQPTVGQTVTDRDVVKLRNRVLTHDATQTILFHKPVGYVVSKDGQGSATIYDILPKTYHALKPVGRLDKNSSGLLVLTNDGQLAHSLTHPSFRKVKTYEISVSRPLQPLHRQMISDYGVQLDDGPSKLQLERVHDHSDTEWIVSMSEGRNRQIRRTFEALGYTITRLHRTTFGPYRIDELRVGKTTEVSPPTI